MISASQQEALDALAEVWERSPDVRLGQLFAHLGFLGEIHLGRGLGDIDDDELLGILRRHRLELQARLGDSERTVSAIAASPMHREVAPIASHAQQTLAGS